MPASFRRPPSRRRAYDAAIVLLAAAAGAALMYFLHPDARRRLRPAAQIPDDAVLAQQVRAALGRVTGDVSAVDVRVRDGCVTLKGPAAAEDAAELVACARRVPGVRDVENRFSVHAAS